MKKKIDGSRGQIYRVGVKVTALENRVFENWYVWKETKLNLNEDVTKLKVTDNNESVNPPKQKVIVFCIPGKSFTNRFLILLHIQVVGTTY